MSKSQIEYPQDLRAPGAIDQLIAFHHQTFGDARMEENGGGTGGDEGGAGGTGENTGGAGGTEGGGGTGDGGGDDKDLGFPKDTPVAQMTLEQRAAYWEHNAKRHEARVKGWSKAVGGKTADELQTELTELEQLRQSKLSDADRAVETARQEAKAEAKAEYGTKLVAAKFEGALAHVEESRRAQIIEGLKLEQYLNDDGDVDADKVKSYAAAVAPVVTTTTRRDFGGGHRPEGQPVRGAAGAAEAQRRFNKSTTGA